MRAFAVAVVLGFVACNTVHGSEGRKVQDDRSDSRYLAAIYNEGFVSTQKGDGACLSPLLTAAALGDKTAGYLIADCVSHISSPDDLRETVRDLALLLAAYQCNPGAIDALVLRAEASAKRYLLLEAVYFASMQFEHEVKMGGHVSPKLRNLLEQFRSDLNNNERRLLAIRFRESSDHISSCLQDPDIED